MRFSAWVGWAGSFSILCPAGHVSDGNSPRGRTFGSFEPPAGGLPWSGTFLIPRLLPGLDARQAIAVAGARLPIPNSTTLHARSPRPLHPACLCRCRWSDSQGMGDGRIEKGGRRPPFSHDSDCPLITIAFFLQVSTPHTAHFGDPVLGTLQCPARPRTRSRRRAAIL